ncbi:aminotransferase class I/II-fold pyridoxal phosphate-dependent enzyme [Saccharothrix syringae]|uniref:aminotransferase class I/II-fold pyridoxal phosphate-dependent enzyme n=1 Tax=Saccharothrix syringae TaxID=103733 RepID=UPI00052409C9|nr:aminotransferase class I/II-fold pyridoxal phosphate-dependent enzyme [Saccharothrix syringae]
MVQSVSPPGVVDLRPGYLDPDLLPVDLLAEAYQRAFTEFGAAALSYGADQGALVLRSALAARTAEAELHACGPDNVLVTAGTSHALHLLATRLAAPGDVVLVEQTSYDFGRRILTDRGLRLRPVAMDGEGVHPGALHDAMVAERAAGGRIAFACLTPTFHNPTGLLVPAERRRELLAVAARHDVLVVEDDAYAGLELGGTPVECSLAGLAGYRGVVRLRTFSKTLAPGLRLGWLLAAPEFVRALVAQGVFVSGGSMNHVASLAVAELIRTGAYDRHLGWLRGRLRARRDALADALRAGLPADLGFELPAGGFFLWLTSRGGRTEADLLAAAGRAGVHLAGGTRFGTPAAPSLRLAYSFTPPGTLAAAGRRLAAALTGGRS